MFYYHVYVQHAKIRASVIEKLKPTFRYMPTPSTQAHYNKYIFLLITKMSIKRESGFYCHVFYV